MNTRPGFDKSELLTTTITRQDSEDLATAMGCKSGEFPFTYLGLPLSNKTLPRSAYLPLVQKFRKRLQGWTAKWYWQWVDPEERMWKTIFRETNLILYPTPRSYFFSITLKDTYNFMDTFLLRIPGKGNTIIFWWHDWGTGILRHQMPTLFTFAMQQQITLEEALHTTNLASLFRSNLSEMAAE